MMLLALLVATHAGAATFTVTTTNISGPGSLPVALLQANSTPGSHIVNFGVTNPIIIGLPLPVITNNVRIEGRADVPTIISGGQKMSLFNVAAGTTNTFSRLSLIDGFTTEPIGAAIQNAGQLTLQGCYVSGHTGGYGGGPVYPGAIYNCGNLLVENCTLTNNLGQFGGAIANSNACTLTVVNSTISYNASFTFPGYGGGICSKGGKVVLISSTFFANRASQGGAVYMLNGLGLFATNCTSYTNQAPQTGGGISTVGENALLANCTVVRNTGGNSIPNAGGLCCNNGVCTLINTVVAENTTGLVSGSPDIYGQCVTKGVNLIGDNRGAIGLSLNDYQNVPSNLGALQDNGGPTWTCRPMNGSLTIRNGSGLIAPLFDQRGVPRSGGNNCDIGAIETTTESPTILGPIWLDSMGFHIPIIFDSTNTFSVEASTNLSTWSPLMKEFSGGSRWFIDSSATNIERRYYRVTRP